MPRSEATSRWLLVIVLCRLWEERATTVLPHSLASLTSKPLPPPPLPFGYVMAMSFGLNVHPSTSSLSISSLLLSLLLSKALLQDVCFAYVEEEM